MTRAEEALKRWYTKAKYTLYSQLQCSTIRGKDWSFIANFDDLADFAKFDLQLEALYRSRLKDLKLIKAGHYEAEIFAGFKKFDALFTQRYRVLICIPWVRIGGAERVAANLAATIRHLFGKHAVAVLVLDFTYAQIQKRFPNEPTIHSWFPSDVPIIDLTETTTLDAGCRLSAFAKLILNIAPEFVVTVNSRTMWDCYLSYGPQLSRYVRLIGCLFCNDYDPRGAPVGYAASYFRETLSSLYCVITDQAYFISELAGRYMLVPRERAKLRCIYQPIAAPKSNDDRTRIERLRRPQSYRRQILWAGRLTQQKDPELLRRIADRAQFCDFHVFGIGEKPGLRQLPNLFYRGSFKRFDDISPKTFDAFLYTSRWDGLPNILLEAAAHRLPIIAQSIGGVGELVKEETGWPVERPSDLEQFLLRLHQVCFEFDRQHGPSRLESMSGLIAQRHSYDTFYQSVESVFASEI